MSTPFQRGSTKNEAKNKSSRRRRISTIPPVHHTKSALYRMLREAVVVTQNDIVAKRNKNRGRGGTADAPVSGTGG